MVISEGGGVEGGMVLWPFVDKIGKQPFGHRCENHHVALE
jgi:hypothetical protein